jgi:hypothetical protein
MKTEVINAYGHYIIDERSEIEISISTGGINTDGEL